MDIDKIRNSLFIKDLDQNGLQKLEKDIRERIISYVGLNGGYLYSNLAALPVSIAVNRVFTANDLIFYSGKDLIYADNIINGHVDDLDEPSRIRSLAAMTGLAEARSLADRDEMIVYILDSDDMLKENNIEALNRLSMIKGQMILIYLEDQRKADVSFFRSLFVSFFNNRPYYTLKENVKRVIRPIRNGDEIIKGIHDIKAVIKKNILNEGIFEKFNIDYVGPIDSGDINMLIKALQNCCQKEYPTVIHCICNVKDIPLKNEDITYIGRQRPFDQKTFKPRQSDDSSNAFLKTQIAEEIESMMKDDGRIYCVCPDDNISHGFGKIFAAYPQRCFQTDSDMSYTLEYSLGLSAFGRSVVVACRDTQADLNCTHIRNIFKNKDCHVLLLIADDGNLDRRLFETFENICIYQCDDPTHAASALHTFLEDHVPAIIIYKDRYLAKPTDRKIEKLVLGKWQDIANNDVGCHSLIITADSEKADLICQAAGKDMPVIRADFIEPIDRGVLDSYPDLEQVMLCETGIDSKLLRHINEAHPDISVKIISMDQLKLDLEKEGY